MKGSNNIIKINISQNSGKVELISNKRSMGSWTFSYTRDLIEKLNQTLDKILKSNKIDRLTVSSYSVRFADLGDYATSNAMARAFVAGLRHTH